MMQEGRAGGMRRGSSGSIAVEQSLTTSDVPGTLKTSPVIYAGPVSPDRKKFASYLVGGPPQCPDQQPRSPFGPPGVALTAPWMPFTVVPLPPRLVFETWWHEGSKRVNMHVTYDTATRRCLAGTYVSLDMEVTTPFGGDIDEYDLHVGAELRVAGRRVTLRKAITLATLTWLDQQARAMLIAKFRLEQDLAKFRPVVPVPGQYVDVKRAEGFDLGSHQHMPAGGRLNLRALHNFILGLVEQHRQHRSRLPPLPDVVSERVSVAAETMPGPPDWSPERRDLERRDAEARQREALDSHPADDTWRNDLTNWLDSIPLAASCCTSYPAGGSAVGEGRGNSKERERVGGGGPRGANNMRPSGHGMAGRAGVGGGAGRGGGGAPALAFNISVINRLGGGPAGLGAAGGSGGPPASRLQGFGLSSPPTARTLVGSVGPGTPKTGFRQR